MEFMLDRKAGPPLWQQIYRQVADRVRAGQLPPGTRLPPERLLAAELGVNRTTVVQAYRELAADGLVVARVGSGTRVAPLAEQDPAGPAAPDTEPGRAEAGRSGPGRPAAASSWPLGSPATPGRVTPGRSAAGGGPAWGPETELLWSPGSPAGQPVGPLDWGAYLAGIPTVEEPAVLREARAVRARAGIISLASGELAPELVPAQQLTELFTEALAAGSTWGYAPSSGYGPLREGIAGRLAAMAAAAGARGRTAPGQVVVTAGAQQGLLLVTHALIEPGDAVAVESPSYYRCLTGLFTAAGARVLAVPVDRDGLQPDALEQLLKRYRLRAVFTIPSHQNPTGATMPLERRQHLLALAARYQVPLVEDDIYGELSFAEPIPSLKALDPGGLVIQIGSFSKSVAAGLRLGWVAGPSNLADRVAALKSQLEPGGSLVNQYAMAEMIRRGWLDRHLAHVCRALQERRDRLVAALHRHLPGCSWQVPRGGFHLWVEPPAHHSALSWFRAAARAGVAVMPGEVYGAGRGTARGIRLNFSYPPLDQMEEAVRRLARALKRSAREEPDAAAGGALV